MTLNANEPCCKWSCPGPLHCFLQRVSTELEPDSDLMDRIGDRVENASGEPARKRPRVLLLEDDPIVSRALARRFGEQVDIVPVRTLREAEARQGETWEGVIVDRGLPDGDGLPFAKAMAARIPGASVVMFSGADPVRAWVEASRHGIVYVDKNDGTAIIARMIVMWARGPRANTPSDRLAALAAVHDLSARECDVIRYRLAGKTRSQAARDLGIAERTHRNHVTNILDKTGFSRLAQLVAHLTT